MAIAGALAVAIAPSSARAIALNTNLVKATSRQADRSGGILGWAALHLESGRRLSLRGARRFPMASVFKLPVALQYLRLVDRGQAGLGDSVSLRNSDSRSGESPLPRAAARGRWVTSERLLRLAIQESDNTAADVLLRLAGGPAAVTKRLRELGIRDIDVSRSEARLMADWNGVAELPPESEWTRSRLDSAYDSVRPVERPQARRKFSLDDRDTATPEAVVDLLAKLYRREALSPASTEWLLEVMAGTKTGPGRLKGRLPRGTWVAHKTGTMGDVVNDVGIIALPRGRGHLAIAAFAEQGNPVRSEHEIARIARILYDGFLPSK